MRVALALHQTASLPQGPQPFRFGPAAEGPAGFNPAPAPLFGLTAGVLSITATRGTDTARQEVRFTVHDRD